MRRTKILATVGPATRSDELLRRVLRAGANAFRINLAHGSAAEHRTTIRQLHAVRERAGADVALVADVPGPKIRIGRLDPEVVSLRAGQQWTFDRSRRPGDGRRVGLEVPRFDQAARPGDPILLGDGSVDLEVTRVHRTSITARVRTAGPVHSQAGVYLPRAALRASSFGPADRRAAAPAVEEGIDFLALSFVRAASDIRTARRWLDTRPGGASVGLIAKIERAEALGAIDEILESADGIMVARGDLGIEVPLEKLALEQKRLIERANATDRFVIVATQMLLSMVDNPRPTRAEATDVANAVLDGTDALMLSEESAIGRYPVRAVGWLDRIASATERAFDPRRIRESLRPPPPGDPGFAEHQVAEAAVVLAEGVGASAIVVPTHSGRTARLVAQLRPRCPVLALSRSETARRRLALVRGVVARTSPLDDSFVDLRRHALEVARASGLAGRAPVVLTAGFPVDGRPSNLVTVVDPTEGRK